MTQTIEAFTDQNGILRVVEPVPLPKLRRVVITVLEDTVAIELDVNQPTLQQLVDETKALPFNPNNLRLADSSLLAALQNGPDDPDFDLATWQTQWAMVEAEMKAVEQANDVAEGQL